MTFLHERLKRTRGSSQAKWHPLTLVESQRSNCEGCPLLVGFFQLDLPIPTFEIQGREPLGSRQRIQRFVNPGYWVGVPDGSFVQLPEVDAEP